MRPEEGFQQPGQKGSTGPTDAADAVALAGGIAAGETDLKAGGSSTGSPGGQCASCEGSKAQQVAIGATRIAAAASGAKSGGGGGRGARVGGDALKAARAEFSKVKPQFWKHQAARNPGAWAAGDLARMKRGKAAIGADGHPMELHHRIPLAQGGTNNFDNLAPLTRTEHRLGPNYKRNHPNLP